MRKSAVSLLFFGFAAAALLGAAELSKQNTTHVGGKPSSLVRLFAIVGVGEDKLLSEVGPDGQIIGPFALPNKSVLVVTDLIASVNGTPNAGVTYGGLVSQALSGSIGPRFSFDATQQGSQSIHLTSGVRWSQVPRAINSSNSEDSVFVNVYGYVAKDK